MPPRSRKSNEWSAVNKSSVSAPAVRAVRSMTRSSVDDAIEPAADAIGVRVPLHHQEVAARVAGEHPDRPVHGRL